MAKRTKTTRAYRVGLMVGREWSFPPAFIDEVHKRDAGVTVDFVKIGAPHHDDPVPYDVIIDRISHEVPMYRSFLKHAVLAGATVVNNPFMWTADDKFFGASLITKLGVASPKTVVLPNKQYVPGIKHDESLRNLEFPLDWQAIVEYVGLPCILKDAHGGGWRDVYVCRSLDELIHHYDTSGLLTMIVQEFIEWEHFVRCMCLGQEEILPMKYDPRRAEVHRGARAPVAGARRADREGRDHDREGVRLRHELDRVRGARRHSLRDRLHESGAGHGHQLADAGLFPVGGDAHGRHGDQSGQETAETGEGAEVEYGVYGWPGLTTAVAGSRPSTVHQRNRDPLRDAGRDLCVS